METAEVENPTAYEEIGYNNEKSVNHPIDQNKPDGSMGVTYRIYPKQSKTILDKDLPPMSDRLWMEYDGENSHDIIKKHQSYTNNPRRKRHDLYRDTVALPEHLVRIEFLMGNQRGCQYVYGREYAEPLVRSRRAFVVENQIESRPLRVAEVLVAINAAREKDGFPPINALHDQRDREPGEEG